VHGRIYRVTYPSRPLVTPAKIAGARIGELLENLKLPEARTRYRTRRELRGRDAGQVVAAAKAWAARLPAGSERLKLESLWVTWGADQVDEHLLRESLAAKDHRVRAAAVRVLRYNSHRIADQRDLLLMAANDDHGRVRLEAITAASHLEKASGMPILEAAKAKGLDKYSQQSFDFAYGVLNDIAVHPEVVEVIAPGHLKGVEAKRYVQGAAIYEREGHCGTCHQVDGQGLPDAGFPPVAGTKWANGDVERLLKITLKGLHGPITVKGKAYPGFVPMTSFEKLLNDREIAAVLTYVRNSFGNKASAVSPDQVKATRKAADGQEGFYDPAKLLKEHPHN
jgi:mono/diheme cytochrome c family protein